MTSFHSGLTRAHCRACGKEDLKENLYPTTDYDDDWSKPKKGWICADCLRDEYNDPTCPLCLGAPTVKSKVIKLDEGDLVEETYTCPDCEHKWRMTI